MTNEEMEKLDVIKIQKEISQIVNQRFTLTTSSFVAFIAIIGWLSNNIQDNSTDSLSLACGISTFLNIVLFVLFIYFFSLSNMMRIYTTYLKTAYSDKWEEDWLNFRLHSMGKNGKPYRYFGYSKIGLLNFSLLGLISFIFPILLVFISPDSGDKTAVEFSTLYQNNAFIWSLIIFLIYEICIFSLTIFRFTFLNEDKKIDRWKAALGKDDIIS